MRRQPILLGSGLLVLGLLMLSYQNCSRANFALGSMPQSSTQQSADGGGLPDLNDSTGGGGDASPGRSGGGEGYDGKLTTTFSLLDSTCSTGVRTRIARDGYNRFWMLVENCQFVNVRELPATQVSVSGNTLSYNGQNLTADRANIRTNVATCRGDGQFDVASPLQRTYVEITIDNHQSRGLVANMTLYRVDTATGAVQRVGAQIINEPINFLSQQATFVDYATDSARPGRHIQLRTPRSGSGAGSFDSVMQGGGEQMQGAGLSCVIP